MQSLILRAIVLILPFWLTDMKMKTAGFSYKMSSGAGKLSCGFFVLMFPVANRSRLQFLACLACCFDEAVCSHPLCCLLLVFQMSGVFLTLSVNEQCKEWVKVQNSYKNAKVSLSVDCVEITRFAANQQGCKCIVKTNKSHFTLAPGTRSKQTCRRPRRSTAKEQTVNSRR